MVIFHSYVSLPEGIQMGKERGMHQSCPEVHFHQPATDGNPWQDIVLRISARFVATSTIQIWVWVKIRYPNNWMVDTKLD